MSSLPPGLKLRPLKLVDALPKFLIADDLDSARTFVVHTEHPRFIAEVRLHGEQTVLDPTWQDDAPTTRDSAEIRDLMNAAGAFYIRSLASNDRN